jgi:hypothetical protein
MLRHTFATLMKANGEEIKTIRELLRHSNYKNGAPFRVGPRGHQLHTLLDLRGAIPAFLYISGGRLNEINVLDFLPIEAGSFYVMDRGYLDFRRLFAMYQADAFFVTRARSAMDARRVYSDVADRNRGVICDQRVMFNGRSTSKKYPEQIRRIRFKASKIPTPERRWCS